ncbi:MAG: HD-GYP domain-containing protein [Actinomycetota bacterium]|nr:MAG: HD-GYP domain-containing protein [Actinomycetota bacterium]
MPVDREDGVVTRISWRVQAYVGAVTLAGVAVLILAALHPLDWSVIVPLAILVVLGETFGQRTAGGVSVSVAMPVAIASILLVGPWGSALVGASVALTWERMEHMKRAFNGAMSALSALAAGTAYLLTGGVVPISTSSFPSVLLPVAVAMLVYGVVNATLLVLVVSLVEELSPVRVWRNTVAEFAVPLVTYSLFGLLLAVVWTAGVEWFAAVLVLLPFGVARWSFAQYAATREAYEATIRSLIQAVETKDAYTRGHSERVSRASVMIGRRTGISEDRVQTLRYAGILHDVGKLGVPTRVLQKSGRLTDDEYASIQLHPVRGRDITVGLDFLGEAVEGIYHHHERVDGLGYPLGLKGKEIPEFARIIAVADAFDSMTTTRSYRGARSIDEAVAELHRCAGTQFEPDLVGALVRAVREEGWQVVDTTPRPGGALDYEDRALQPTLASDDDDPTAAAALAAHRPSRAQLEGETGGPVG